MAARDRRARHYGPVPPSAPVVANPLPQSASAPSAAVRAWWRAPTPWALGALALTVAVAEFRDLRLFGLYEDDYLFVGQAMGRGPEYLVERLKVITGWAQGRPIGFYLPDLLSWLGDHLGGLPAIYVLGAFVVLLNGALAYLLLRRVAGVALALPGALFFTLFPADTTKFLLTHAFQLQPSLTFLLAALLLYTGGQRGLAYVVSVGSLLTYESPFPVFAAAPLLLASTWQHRRWRTLGLHVLAGAALFVGAVAVRLLFGEGRAAGATGSVGQLLPPFFGSLVLGPTRALLLFLYGPLRALPGWGVGIAVWALPLGALLGWVAWRGWQTEPVPSTSNGASLPPRRAQRRQADVPLARSPLAAPRVAPLQSHTRAQSFRVSASEETPLSWPRLLVTGLVMLGLGYALAFTHYPPVAVTGRGTSVHLGATLGATLVFVGLLGAALSWASRPRWRAAVGAALGMYFALLVGYELTIQRDFVTSWQIQRTFWRDVLTLAPDVQDGTVLVFELPGPPETTFVDTNSWADPIVLPMLRRFPDTWATPPRLFSMRAAEWEARLERQPDGSLRWWVPAATWDEHWEPLPDGNVILFRRVAGVLTRVEGTVDVQGTSLRLKPPVPGASVPGTAGRLDATFFGD